MKSSKRSSKSYKTAKAKPVAAKTERIKAAVVELAEREECRILLADGFDAALMGIVRQFNAAPVACYDRAKCLAILRKEGMSADEAEEYFEFNVIGAWAGEATPVFLECPEPS